MTKIEEELMGMIQQSITNNGKLLVLLDEQIKESLEIRDKLRTMGDKLSSKEKR